MLLLIGLRPRLLITNYFWLHSFSLAMSPTVVRQTVGGTAKQNDRIPRPRAEGVHRRRILLQNLLPAAYAQPDEAVSVGDSEVVLLQNIP